MGRIDWLSPAHVRYPQHASHQGGAHLPATNNLRAAQLLLGYTKLESTVRYLGIEVDDALELIEQTEA